MSKSRSILSAFVSIALICTNAMASDCTSKKYADAHPYECMMKSNAALILGGGAVIGGVAALIGTMSSSGGASSSASVSSPTSATIPTLQVPRFVGADITAAELASITSSATYAPNFNHYNEIGLGYSLARGYTGAGTNIAVLDAKNWHGASVMDFASNTIAPNASVKFYQVADLYGDFVSYNEIGNQIAAAADAHIFNASWSVTNRATDIYSREQIAHMTSHSFINQMAAAASRDAVFVFAAGNEGHTQSSALSALPLVVPELQGHFVNVVAYDTAAGRLADFSNQCGITQNYCITAPGTNLNTSASDTPVSGTSFAAPIVSAAIAVIREAHPYMTTPQITSLLFETARDLGVAGIDPVYGHGMLDMERATRPVGVALVPVAADNMVPLNSAHVSGNIAHNIKSADLEMAFFDAYGRPFKTKVADNISIRNQGRAFARLRGANELAANFGNIEFGMRTSDLTFGDGFMSTESNTMAGFVGARNEIAFGDVTLYQRTRIGWQTPRASENSIISSFSNIYTADIRVGMQYGNWNAYIAVPETVVSGDMTLRLATNRAADGTILYRDARVDMTGRPAMEYSVSYKNISASFIDNPYGTDEFFIMTRGRVQF